MAEASEQALTWLHDEPMPRAAVTPDGGYEVTVRAFRGPAGRIEPQDAVIRREAGGRVEPAAVLAWARALGNPLTARPWSVLAVWLDTADGGRTRSGRLEWRGGWMTYVPGLLEPSGPWRPTTEYWYTRRDAAIVRTLRDARVRPVSDPRVEALQALAARVRDAVQTLTLPGIDTFTPPPFELSIDLPGRRVVLSLRHWTSWGPRQVLTGRLERAFPGIEFWTDTAYIRLPDRTASGVS
jgi:hypothetical protein